VRHLDIAEVALRSGVAASALRFYEEKGLIASVGRRGLRRLFDPLAEAIGAAFATEGPTIVDAVVPANETPNLPHPELMPSHNTPPIHVSRGRVGPARRGSCHATARSRARRLAS